MRQHGVRIVRWFYPGLGVKRWLCFAVVGAMLVVNGLTRYLTGEGIVIPINERLDSGCVRGRISFRRPCWPRYFSS